MKEETYKTCPYCGEQILASAKKCRHCKSWLTEEKQPQTSNKPSSNLKTVMTMAIAILAVANLIMGFLYANKTDVPNYTAMQKDSVLVKEMLGFRKCNNRIDSLSYALGVAQSLGFNTYLQSECGVDTINNELLYYGLTEIIMDSDTTRYKGYIMGINIGSNIINKVFQGVEENMPVFNTSDEAMSEEDKKKMFIKGFFDGCEGNYDIMTLEESKALNSKLFQE